MRLRRLRMRNFKLAIDSYIFGKVLISDTFMTQLQADPARLGLDLGLVDRAAPVRPERWGGI